MLTDNSSDVTTKTGIPGSPKEISYRHEPWLLWLSGLRAGLQMERSLVRFSVRGQGTCLGWEPLWGHVRGNKYLTEMKGNMNYHHYPKRCPWTSITFELCRRVDSQTHPRNLLTVQMHIEV